MILLYCFFSLYFNRVGPALYRTSSRFSLGGSQCPQGLILVLKTLLHTHTLRTLSNEVAAGRNAKSSGTNALFASRGLALFFFWQHQHIFGNQ
uniref:Putative secreted protein n=1 Tax=Anopheles marajoara TaxID=58244 RepID=A0A2M4C9K9_9DIPT